MLLLVAGMSSPVHLSARSLPDSIGGLARRHELTVPSGARYMDVDEEGNIFLTFPETGMIRKYLYSRSYDSVISIGGRGGKGESFSYPSIIRVQNRQNTWVLDQGTSRLMVLNTNMKVVGTISFMSGDEPVFPQTFAVLPSGEFIIANALDNRLYKFNTMGQLLIRFGGLDMGDCNLYGPSDMMAGGDGFISVVDTASGTLVRFDLFGGCAGLLDAAIPAGIRCIRSFPNGLLLWGSNLILIRLSPGIQRKVTLPTGTPDLLAAAAMGNKLFLLFPDKVAIYAP